MNDLQGFTTGAPDGDIGHVDDFLVEASARDYEARLHGHYRPSYWERRARERA